MNKSLFYALLFALVAGVSPVYGMENSNSIERVQRQANEAGWEKFSQYMYGLKKEETLSFLESSIQLSRGLLKAYVTTDKGNKQILELMRDNLKYLVDAYAFLSESKQYQELLALYLEIKQY